MQKTLGPNAKLLSVSIITTSDKRQAGPQELHRDHASGASKELKLVFSMNGHPLMTELGVERTPMKASAMIFDAVRTRG